MFEENFGTEPAAVGVAPGRVNLIGEHVDYEGGLALPMAINRWIAVALKTCDQARVKGVTTESPGKPWEQTTGKRRPDGPWVKYIVGVLEGYRRLGWKAAGANIAVSSSLPAGAGLSSSAALETAAAVAMEACGAPALPAKDRAALCQRAEQDFAGVPCGIMDQLTAGCARAGHALSIDCRDLECATVALPQGISVLVVDTRVRHKLGESEYPRRRSECRKAAELLNVKLLRDASLDQIETRLDHARDHVISRRARHVVSEIERVTEFVAALRLDDREGIRRAMSGSHDSLRDLFDVSCPELDTLVEIGREQQGVVGCRMTGGGFGGSVVMLVETTFLNAVETEILSRYSAATGLEARALRVEPAAAARVVELEKTLEP